MQYNSSYILWSSLNRLYIQFKFEFTYDFVEKFIKSQGYIYTMVKLNT